jgi:hypothetical protein
MEHQNKAQEGNLSDEIEYIVHLDSPLTVHILRKQLCDTQNARCREVLAYKLQSDAKYVRLFSISSGFKKKGRSYCLRVHLAQSRVLRSVFMVVRSRSARLEFNQTSKIHRFVQERVHVWVKCLPVRILSPSSAHPFLSIPPSTWHKYWGCFTYIQMIRLALHHVLV